MKLVKEIHDKRGDIYKFEIDSKPFLLVYTKKGFLRGGEIHNTIQYNILLRGKATIIMNDKRKEHSIKLEVGEAIVIEPETPHYFIFHDDSLMTEEYPENIEVLTEYHPKYRKIVEDSFK